MGSFTQLAAKRRAPGKTIVLPLAVFADKWDRCPDSPVCVGLRQMSEGDKTKARGEAERLADEVHPRGGPDWVDCYNDALMRQVAALGICDPNDVKRPSDLLPFAEEEVRFALTSFGARFIFEELQRYEIEVSPLESEATDEELARLVMLLEGHAHALTGPHRRLLRAILEELDLEVGEVDVVESAASAQ